MKVSEVMTREVRTVRPTETISDAARIMAEIDTGALPVEDNDRLIGMITDRDIAIRAVAQHKAPDTPVREVMTEQVLYCYDDQDVEECSRNMAEKKVRRLPVVNRDKRLVGIFSVGDLARKGKPEKAAEAIAGIAQPGGEHSQSAETH
jgi:CBS domain-containing protein